MLIYILIRILTFPFRYLPLSWIHVIGRGLGIVAFHSLRTYRKRTLSNLALASGLNLQTEDELLRIAKQSFQNLAINLLEYARFDRETDFSPIIQYENPEIARSLYEQGQGLIFFCGHQSNWEVLFLDGTSRMRGIAIGKPIKNQPLYRWILSIREKKGGTIIDQRHAIKEGLRALQKGLFVGILSDQGMPTSHYAFPFLGRMAWTTTAPALLSYKTRSPLIVATTRRVKGGYRIRYSDPIWPNCDWPMDREVPRLMDQALSLLQQSILCSPGEWLWQHNRWKQQTPRIVYKRFRHDCICVVLPDQHLDELLPHLLTLKKIYPSEFLVLFIPAQYQDLPLIDAHERIIYQNPEELLRHDYRFKLIFNFTSVPLTKHYERLSVFETLTIPKLQKLATSLKDPTLSDLLQCVLCRPGAALSQIEKFKHREHRETQRRNE